MPISLSILQCDIAATDRAIDQLYDLTLVEITFVKSTTPVGKE